jgi:hypothetical protein
MNPHGEISHAVLFWILEITSTIELISLIIELIGLLLTL